MCQQRDEDTARARFQYVRCYQQPRKRSLYRITRDYWEVLKPTAVITPEELKTRMEAIVPFPPSSFWVR